MKLSERVPKGSFYSLIVPSIGVGGSLGYLLTSSAEGSLVGAITLMVASIVSRSILISLIALLASLALTSLVVSFSSYLFGKNSGAALVITIFFYFSILITFRKLSESNPFYFETVESAKYLPMLASLPALIISFYWARGSNVSALQFLSSTGEDNAAWLEGLASGIKDGSGPIVSPGLAFGGGEHLIVPQAVLQFLFDLSVTMQLVDNAKLLKIEYGILAILFVALSNFATLFLMKSLSSVKLISLIAVQSVFSYALISSLISSGHLTAVISTVYLSSALALAATLNNSDFKKETRVFLSFLIAALVYSAGKVWYPLAPATNFIVLAFLIYSIARQFNWSRLITRFRDLSRESLLLRSMIFFVLILLGALALFVANNLELVTLDKIKATTAPLGLLGATASASAIVLIAALLGATWLLRDSSQSINFSTFIVATLMGYFAIIIFASLVATPGFTIRYAATKLAVVLCALFVPYFLLFVYSQSFRINNIQALVVSFGLIAIFVFDGTLGQFVNFPLKLDKSVNKTWSKAVVAVGESQDNPSVVCLNSDDKIRNYEAYLCTRMSIGLFGNYGLYNYAHSTWSGALLGGGEKDFVKDIEDDFYNDLTVIAFDGSKVSNGDPIQDVWIKEVPWSKVNIIGLG
jgi:hypothetical protein